MKNQEYANCMALLPHHHHLKNHHKVLKELLGRCRVDSGESLINHLLTQIRHYRCRVKTGISKNRN